MEARVRSARAVLLVLVCACAQGGGDGGTPRDGGRSDAARRDGGRDAGRHDAGRDAGPRRDSGFTDAGRIDASMPDAGGMDASVPDAGGGDCTLGEGALAIVEVMIAARSGPGDRGEWFEVVNTLDCTADLAGLVVVSPTAGTEQSHTVTGGTIAPGQHFVFALSGDAAENHRLPHDYVYGTGSASDVLFANDADWLELRAGVTTIDRVEWPSGGFTHGRARQFPDGADPGDNGNWSRWCDATDIYSDAGGTFYGTPQRANGTCP